MLLREVSSFSPRGGHFAADNGVLLVLHDVPCQSDALLNRTSWQQDPLLS